MRDEHQWQDVSAAVNLAESELEVFNYDGLYERQITDFESQQGPYANTLAEPLLGLGKVLDSRGNYEQAIALYRRALHIQRLNDGLYSKLQAPTVRALLDSVRASGDLNELDHLYDYYFRLYGNGQPPYTEFRRQSALEYLRWQREALRLEIDGQDSPRLLQLYNLNEDLLDAGGFDGVGSEHELWQLTMGQMRNLYLVQSRVMPPMAISSNGNLFPSMMDQGMEIDLEQRQLEAILRSALTRGTQVLEQFIAVESEWQLRGMLELADWYQWNGSYRLASKHYANLVKMLLDSGEEGLMHAWFGEPVELPDNGAFWQPAIGEGDEGPVIATATFDVSTRGRAKNITVTAQREEDKKLAMKFRRELVKTQFRPRYDNGKAVSTSALQRKYELYE